MLQHSSRNSIYAPNFVHSEVEKYFSSLSSAKPLQSFNLQMYS